MNQKEKNVIYHYCSVDTFNAIINNNCLRLSDLNKTNDYMEKKWIAKIIEEALEKEFKALNINIQLREDYWYDEGIDNHISNFNELLQHYLQKPSYISCFSKNSDKLSQWRANGNKWYRFSNTLRKFSTPCWLINGKKGSLIFISCYQHKVTEIT